MDARKKRWLRTILGGTALGLAGVLAGNMLFPDPLPALLEGLDSDHARAGQQLTARVRSRFPVGTPEQGVRAALAEQGFTIHPADRAAEWQRRGVPCTELARIWWREERGRISMIEGLRGAICP